MCALVALMGCSSVFVERVYSSFSMFNGFLTLFPFIFRCICYRDEALACGLQKEIITTGPLKVFAKGVNLYYGLETSPDHSLR